MYRPVLQSAEELESNRDQDDLVLSDETQSRTIFGRSGWRPFRHRLHALQIRVREVLSPCANSLPGSFAMMLLLSHRSHRPYRNKRSDGRGEPARTGFPQIYRIASCLS